MAALRNITWGDVTTAARNHPLVAGIIIVVALAVIAYLVLAVASIFGSDAFSELNSFMNKNLGEIVFTAAPLIGVIAGILYKRYHVDRLVG